LAGSSLIELVYLFFYDMLPEISSKYLCEESCELAAIKFCVVADIVLAVFQFVKVSGWIIGW
jgi:hypothetical protein